MARPYAGNWHLAAPTDHFARRSAKTILAAQGSLRTSLPGVPDDSNFAEARTRLALSCVR
jgi:hypothetical protein